MRSDSSRILSAMVLLIFCSLVAPSVHGGEGYLRFRGVETDSVRLVLNGISQCVSGSSFLRIPAGRHQLVVQNPRMADFSRLDFEHSITIAEGETTVVDVRFPRLFLLTSQPFGAGISVGGRLIGETPMHWPADSLPKGIRVDFAQVGYSTETWFVSSSDLDSGARRVHLKPIPGSKAEKNRVNAFWKKTGHEKHRKTLMTTAGLALLSGAATAYFKNMADDRFERAKIARQNGDLTLQKKLEKETRRLDRYSLVGLISLEINVGLLLGMLILSK